MGFSLREMGSNHFLMTRLWGMRWLPTSEPRLFEQEGTLERQTNGRPWVALWVSSGYGLRWIILKEKERERKAIMGWGAFRRRWPDRAFSWFRGDLSLLGSKLGLNPTIFIFSFAPTDGSLGLGMARGQLLFLCFLFFFFLVGPEGKLTSDNSDKAHQAQISRNPLDG